MPVLEIAGALESALEAHRAGRLEVAERIYRDILSIDPAQSMALHLLGVLAGQKGRAELGVELIGRAIAIDPDVPAYSNNLANLLREQGRLEPAIGAYRRAVELNPEYAEAFNNLGHALSTAGRLHEAIRAYLRAVELRPNFTDALLNLASALRESGRIDEALKAYSQAIELQPVNVAARNNLAMLLRDKGRHDEAVAQYRQAMLIEPGIPETHNNLGVALLEKGEVSQAIRAFRDAISLKATYSDAHTNLGIAHYANSQPHEAVACCRKAVELNPDSSEAHSDMALILLGCGQFEFGWAEHEWRYRCNPNFRPRGFSQAQWDGRELNGRTILVHAEQGFGDTIQFVRFLPEVASRGGRIILECQPELLRLLRTFPSVAQVIARGDALPEFDVHCPLLSLPFALRTTLDSLPSRTPYLHPEPLLAEKWGRKSMMAGDCLNVGLVWAGRPTHSNDRNRSAHLSQFAAIASMPGIRFHSLQKGPAAMQLACAPAGLALIDHAPELDDFADAAALIANLDLVIAVDTAIAHLAGAMGKPVWVLLPYVADWRWMLERQDSPWYPSMRLFRQGRWGDWAEMLGRVAAALRDFYDRQDAGNNDSAASGAGGPAPSGRAVAGGPGPLPAGSFTGPQSI